MPRLSSKTTCSSILVEHARRADRCGIGVILCLVFEEVLLWEVRTLTHRGRNGFTEANKFKELISCFGVLFQVASKAQSRGLSGHT